MIRDENDFVPPVVYNYRVYSPQLTEEVSAAVRRLSWSINKPMTKALAALIKALPALTDYKKFCTTCKDKSYCTECIFNRYYTAEEKAALLAVL
jgi:hypothetical protein